MDGRPIKDQLSPADNSRFSASCRAPGVSIECEKKCRSSCSGPNHRRVGQYRTVIDGEEAAVPANRSILDAVEG